MEATVDVRPSSPGLVNVPACLHCSSKYVKQLKIQKNQKHGLQINY